MRNPAATGRIPNRIRKPGLSLRKRPLYSILRNCVFVKVKTNVFSHWPTMFYKKDSEDYEFMTT